MAGPRRAISTMIAATLTVGCSVAQPIAEGTPADHPPTKSDHPSTSTKEDGKHARRDAAKARTKLADLHVAAPGDDSGYARDRFGRRWADTDHNGCDTRNDILARDLDDVSQRGRCVV